MSAIAELSTLVQVLRKPSGTYDDYGRWSDRSYEAIEIEAAIQPARGHELVRVPEGRRTKGAVVVYTMFKLQTASVETQTQPDRILWHGDTYEIEFVEDWVKDGGFYRAIALEVGQ